jgi:hypothetical protein
VASAVATTPVPPTRGRLRRPRSRRPAQRARASWRGDGDSSPRARDEGEAALRLDPLRGEAPAGGARSSHRRSGGPKENRQASTRLMRLHTITQGTETMWPRIHCRRPSPRRDRSASGSSPPSTSRPAPPPAGHCGRTSPPLCHLPSLQRTHVPASSHSDDPAAGVGTRARPLTANNRFERSATPTRS